MGSAPYKVVQSRGRSVFFSDRDNFFPYEGGTLKNLFLCFFLFSDDDFQCLQVIRGIN